MHGRCQSGPQRRAPRVLMGGDAAAWRQRPSSSSLLMTTATAASPTHTPTGADYRPSSSLFSPVTDATTHEEDAASAPSSGRPASASGDAVDSSIGAACAGRYWAAASARRRGGGRRACRAATRVAALSIALCFCRLPGLPAASCGPLQSVRPQRPSVQPGVGLPADHADAPSGRVDGVGVSPCASDAR